MIIEQHALWGDEPTPEHPATFTAYLADQMPKASATTHPAAVILGGGSFTHIAAHEQEPAALAFLARGYQAFVLDYVTSETGDVSYPNPEADLARLIATIRANADAWRVRPDQIVAVGFSAGGFITASLAAGWKTGPFAGMASARPEQIRPDAAVLCYPVIDFSYIRDVKTRDPRIDLRVPKTGGKTGRDLLNEFLSMVVGGEATDERLAEVCPTTHVSSSMPPTFMWAAADDATTPVAQLYPLAAHMGEEGVAHELHVFDRGGHGLSVAAPQIAADNAELAEAVRPWLPLALSFLERQGIA
ncbi:MAG: alpha/beta hydrolase [Coriobacteriaceae bacterium]|nr:alpha/beta hydrolase [Coriobacteriaceae bacterium]